MSRPGVRAAIFALGGIIAAGIIATDDKDPVVFAVPVLVITTVLVLALTLADRRRGAEELERAAEETGLGYDGIHPLPTVTPILRDAREPAHVLAGDLYPGGPTVRLAALRDQLVVVTDAPSDAIDAGTREWLDEHPLRPEAGIEDELLVVAAPRGSSAGELLQLARELHARL